MPSDSSVSALPAGTELFAHGADVGVRGRGASVEAAFVNAALALMSVMVNPEAILLESRVSVTCAAPDLEMLLVGWLNEIIFEVSAHKMLFGSFEVAIHRRDGGWALTGVLSGERIDPLRHRPAVEVKGATYTELSVRQDHGVWCAQCVVDV